MDSYIHPCNNNQAGIILKLTIVSGYMGSMYSISATVGSH